MPLILQLPSASAEGVPHAAVNPVVSGNTGDLAGVARRLAQGQALSLRSSLSSLSLSIADSALLVARAAASLPPAPVEDFLALLAERVSPLSPQAGNDLLHLVIPGLSPMGATTLIAAFRAASSPSTSGTITSSTTPGTHELAVPPRMLSRLPPSLFSFHFSAPGGVAFLLTMRVVALVTTTPPSLGVL
jgi:hypothetical protein